MLGSAFFAANWTATMADPPKYSPASNRYALFGEDEMDAEEEIGEKAVEKEWKTRQEEKLWRWVCQQVTMMCWMGTVPSNRCYNSMKGRLVTMTIRMVNKMINRQRKLGTLANGTLAHGTLIHTIYTLSCPFLHYPS
jgi:hypothetical protein